MNTDWKSRAFCTAADDHLLYPEGHGISVEKREQEAVRTLCANCEIRRECLTDALETETTSTCWGVRGGLTSAQRTRLLKENQ